jgi:hypothetical protein
VWGIGFCIQGFREAGFRVYGCRGLEAGVWGIGFCIQGFREAGFRVYECRGLEAGVWGIGFCIQGFREAGFRVYGCRGLEAGYKVYGSRDVEAAGGLWEATKLTNEDRQNLRNHVQSVALLLPLLNDGLQVWWSLNGFCIIL